jgi:thiol-disulfide isomerase/thioredoxin
MPGSLRWTLFACLPLAAGLAVALLVTHRTQPPAGPPAPVILPGFELPDPGGRVHSVLEWRGKVLVLNFWATWCAPCRREMPLLDVLNRESAADLSVVGVAIDRVEPVQTFLAESGVRYPVLVGQDEAMQIAQNIVPDFEGLPVSVIVGPAQQILQVHIGELHPQHIRAIAEVSSALGHARISIEQARERLGRAFEHI